MTQHVTDADFETEVLKSDKPVLVDFWASWCGPCKAIAPVLDALSEEKANTLKIAKMDVDANEVTPSTFKVRSIPTLALVKNGQVIDQKVGAMSRSQLEHWLAQHGL